MSQGVRKADLGGNLLNSGGGKEIKPESQVLWPKGILHVHHETSVEEKSKCLPFR